MRQRDEPPREAVATALDVDVGEPPVAGRRGALVGGLWNAASTVLPMASTLALSIVISRRLGPELLGQQSLIAYVTSLIFASACFSVTSASLQLLSQTRGAGDVGVLSHLMRWSAWAHAAMGLTVACALVAIGAARQDLSTAWYLAAATALADALCWSQACRHVAVHGWTRSSMRRLVAQAASPLLGVAAVLIGWGVNGVFIASLSCSLLLLLALRRLALRESPLPVRRPPTPAVRPVLRAWGLFVLSMLITEIVERRLELVFLDWYSDSRALAMYSVAFNVAGVAVTVCTTLLFAAMPSIAAASAGHDAAKVAPTMERALRTVMVLSVLLCAAVLVTGPLVIRLAWGEPFADASRLVRLLALVVLAAPVGALCNAYWTGTGRLRPVLLAGSVGAVVDIALAWTLIPAHGGTGAAVASIGGQGTAAALVLVATMRSGLRPHLPRRRSVLVVLTAGTASSAALEAASHVAHSAQLPVAMAVFVLVVVGAHRALGLLPPEDVNWFAAGLPGSTGRLVATLSPRSAR